MNVNSFHTVLPVSYCVFQTVSMLMGMTSSATYMLTDNSATKTSCICTLTVKNPAHSVNEKDDLNKSHHTGHFISAITN